MVVLIAYFQYGKLINKGHESPGLSVLQRKWDIALEEDNSKIESVVEIKTSTPTDRLDKGLNTLRMDYRNS